MTDRHAADERLREAFQALGDASQQALSPDEVDRVWQAVSGTLPAAERRDLVERMAADPALAATWRVAQELQRASAPGASAARTSRSWVLAGLAAAAVLLIGVTISVYQRRAPDENTFRSGGTYAVASLVQPDATLPRDRFRLRWTPGPQGSRYQVTVTTEDLRVLTTVQALTMAELTVEGGLLADVAPGGRVLWQVVATLPGGESVSSQTFVVRVQ